MMRNEDELLRMLLLLADTQAWLNELCSQCVHALHPPAVKLLNSRSCRLPVTALAHIVERHYYKTMRHPGTGKFNIPLPAIIDLLKEATTIEPIPMKGSINFKRRLSLPEPIGITKNGEAACSVIVITDPLGNIITAYPE